MALVGRGDADVVVRCSSKLYIRDVGCYQCIIVSAVDDAHVSISSSPSHQVLHLREVFAKRDTSDVSRKVLQRDAPQGARYATARERFLLPYILAC